MNFIALRTSKCWQRITHVIIHGLTGQWPVEADYKRTTLILTVNFRNFIGVNHDPFLGSWGFMNYINSQIWFI